jgi:hypothetical protein
MELASTMVTWGYPLGTGGPIFRRTPETGRMPREGTSTHIILLSHSVCIVLYCIVLYCVVLCCVVLCCVV